MKDITVKEFNKMNPRVQKVILKILNWELIKNCDNVSVFRFKTKKKAHKDVS